MPLPIRLWEKDYDKSRIDNREEDRDEALTPGSDDVKRADVSGRH